MEQGRRGGTARKRKSGWLRLAGCLVRDIPPFPLILLNAIRLLALLLHPRQGAYGMIKFDPENGRAGELNEIEGR